MYAVDGVAHVLPSSHDQTERDQEHDRDGVMESKNRRIDVDVTDFNQVL